MLHIALWNGKLINFCVVFIFSPYSVGEKQPMILKWRILSATNDLDRVSAIALPKLPISISNTDLKVASDTKFFPGLGATSCACSLIQNPLKINHVLIIWVLNVLVDVYRSCSGIP